MVQLHQLLNRTHQTSFIRRKLALLQNKTVRFRVFPVFLVRRDGFYFNLVIHFTLK
jgi:hypothetical protein